MMPAVARWTLFAAMALGAANPAAAADEKLLAAARAAQSAMIESLREMVLMESGSQDAAGLKSMADYLDARLRALGAHDVVLSYEPTAAKAVARDEGVLLMAAGTAQARLAVKGVASHAGAAPDQGRNALIELSHQLLQTLDVAKGIPGAQLNWTTATAGSVRNQIPDKAEAGADVRLLAPDAADKLLAALRAKVAEGRRVPDTETTVTLLVGRPPYVAGTKGMALATKAQAIYAELDGRKLILHPSTGGGTDAGYAGRSGKAAVLESLGLAGWGYHAKNEYIEIDSIVPRLYLTTRLLNDLAGE